MGLAAHLVIRRVLNGMIDEDIACAVHAKHLALSFGGFVSASGAGGGPSGCFGGAVATSTRARHAASRRNRSCSVQQRASSGVAAQ